ncbi:methionine ABC transporter permease [Terribacillus saccharophilus]|uniref:Methionine ABC transporter permease n=2 Tax=Bacillaceae TaxID=186817 RepID=A0ABX4H3S8_9BACI|nr:MULTISPECIES: methionine ABC transporter permease [Terribacillus]PAD34142.1 methionine ABC transporter permease [Terribacillus saccharophilus]PAD98026.1 methionine ABC transporter permease [Terribacillus saccharophilus]PAE01802.1 methionine ABC transporter permease [Terribacillus saccharophilus]
MMMDRVIAILPELNQAFLETLLMVSIALAVAILIGLPFGILLFVTDRGLFLENVVVKRVAGLVINLIRSVPFVILLVFLLPFTQFLLNTTIGPLAASVSLSVAAIPFYARIVESSARDIDKGVIEAAIAVGASPWMIIKSIILPEVKPGLITGLTITAISLIGYSAMAGTIGGGGIGDLAIRYGYYRYDNTIMFTTVIVLIVLVQVVQYLGDLIARVVSKR